MAKNGQARQNDCLSFWNKLKRAIVKQLKICIMFKVTDDFRSLLRQGKQNFNKTEKGWNYLVASKEIEIVIGIFYFGTHVFEVCKIFQFGSKVIEKRCW